jgi:hypothetical protein
LRRKYQHLLQFEADLIIVQECEDPAQSTDMDYKSWANNYLWIGSNKNSGLGVFARPSHDLNPLDWPSETFQLFLPFNVNASMSVLAVWTKQANSPTFQYIGQFWKYLQLNRDKISLLKPLIIGDFNSNKIWDKWDRWWNHSDIVNELKALKISSLYHTHYNISQGEETHPTFYLQRNLAKPYHIDYAFLPEEAIERSSLELGLASDWLSISDHMPLVIDVKDQPCRG